MSHFSKSLIVSITLLVTAAWLCWIFSTDEASTFEKIVASVVTRPEVQVSNVPSERSHNADNTKPPAQFILFSGTLSDADVNKFKKLPDEEQVNYVLFHLSPRIESEEGFIIQLLKCLKSGAGFDKLSTDLVRRRATLHADYLIDWISDIFPSANVEYQVKVASMEIAKNKQDVSRWEKLGKILTQLKDRPDDTFEDVQYAILGAMVKDDTERAVQWVAQHDAETAGGLVEHLMSALIVVDFDKAKSFASLLEDKNLKRIAGAYLDSALSNVTR